MTGPRRGHNLPAMRFATLLTVLVAFSVLAPSSPAAAQAPAVSGAPSLAIPTGRLIAAQVLEHRLVEIDVATSAQRAIPTGLGPRAMIVAGDQLIVANRGRDAAPGSDMTIVDLATFTPVRTVFACVACAPSAIALADDGKAYIAAQAHKAIVGFDPPYDAPSRTILTAWGWPTDVVAIPGTKRLVVGMRNTSEIGVVDLETGRAARRTVDLGPALIALRPGTREVYVAADQGTITPLDEAALAGESALPEPIHTGARISGLAFEPGGRYLLVTSLAPMEILVVDVVEKRVASRLRLRDSPSTIVVSPDGAFAAAPLVDGSAVVVVRIGGDGALTVERELALGGITTRMLWLAR